MKDLAILRLEIDRLDDEIMTLLNQRFEKSLEVKAYKQVNNVAVLDSDREQIIHQRIKAFACDPEINRQIVKIYETILQTSKEVQK
ncbi:MAG: chorismate mutase [Culicoidibacterales bacterium]